jgi:Methylase involved in ubiquinone/menaquinone biosynthesis
MTDVLAEARVESPESCDVCGGHTFEHTAVLWPALIAEWELSPHESRYIDVQQGTHCRSCGSNIRSIALARAIMRFRHFVGTLTMFVADPNQGALRVLEINEAGTLHPVLRQLPGHHFASYPEIDMLSLPFPSRSFDLIVHSDTLEHVPTPLNGLKECRRVIDDGGAVIFTVPVIVERLTRSRSGMPPSYHGNERLRDPGMVVHTEFGADVWVLVAQAGFSSCELLPHQFPAGLAILAKA